MTQRVTKARIDDIQRRSKVTTARKVIYEDNRAVNCTAVEDILKDTSLVPNTVCIIFRFLETTRMWLSKPQNSFSDRLAFLGFNLFLMLVVDLLHEFELGVWKAVILHLLRILESVNEDLLVELDRRYGLSLLLVSLSWC
jgi:hypothetical protein